MIDWNVIRIAIDFGLVILIWMVQLIIYPSFLYYSKANLVRWHQIYTGRIAIVVLPLMLFQLAFAILQLLETVSWFPVLYSGLVFFLWGITLLKFAPMHQQISHKNYNFELLSSLIKLNWIRTITWTLLFVCSLVFYFIELP